MTSPDGVTAVRPRMRAAERRAQVVLAAAARFCQVGYHRVALADVADDVGLTAPALYRHFRNKNALLAAAISSGLYLVEDALARTSGGTLDELVTATAGIGLDRPDLWVLLQRESRFLEPDSAEQVHEQFDRVIRGFVRRLQAERPQLPTDAARLLVTAATAVLSSPSAGATSLPRPAHQRELARAALAALRVDLSRAAATAGPPAASLPAPTATPGETADSRRAVVVDSAIELFFERGYGAVTLDDIGASVGMTGPGLYHHFATKADILVTAFDRATSQLAANLERLAAGGRTPGVDGLVASYTDFCLRNRALIGVYVSEAVNVPPPAWERTSAVIRQGVSEWTTALLASDGRLTEPVARVRIRAALGAIHDLARLGHLYQRPQIADEIAAVALAVLLTDAPDRAAVPLSA